MRPLMCGLALLAGALPAWALSVEDEARMGREVMADLRRFGLTADPALDEIGSRLAAVVERKDLPWRFWVIEELEIYNALAAPGGFVFITRAYYEKLNEDEAAFVLGHEMAHVDLRHHERYARRRQDASLGNLLLSVLTGRRASWGTAVDIGSTAYVTHYSRALEKEADLAGYGCAKAAGYDARAAVTALSKLGEQPNLHPWIVNICATHPLLSSREDRLAALGGEEPEDMPTPGPSQAHRRDLTRGLAPFDPPVPIAVRILAPDGKRWENRWRKNFTRHLHLRLIPLGFEIAGDDLMYKPDIGDPTEAAHSRGARYLLLVTVHEMVSAAKGRAELRGAPVEARIDGAGRLISVPDGAQMWEARFAEEKEGWDVLAADREILYTDTCVGMLAEECAGEIALGCARAAGAREAEEAAPQEPSPEGMSTDAQ